MGATAESLFASVCLFMPKEVIWSSESIATVVTFIRAIPAVNQLMNFDMRHLGEGLAADVTPESFLPHVGPLVPDEAPI